MTMLEKKAIIKDFGKEKFKTISKIKNVKMTKSPSPYIGTGRPETICFTFNYENKPYSMTIQDNGSVLFKLDVFVEELAGNEYNANL